MRLMICAIDIFVGDAVGNHCLGIARCAQRSGWEVRLYARNFDIGVADIRPISALFDEIAPEDLLLVSYSIVDPQLDRLLALPNRKACYFHGVTDPALLREFEPVTAEYCEQAIAQLPQLVDFDLVVANSAYVAGGLAQYMDLRAIEVIPPVFADLPAFAVECTPRHENGRFNMLALGRVVPHKRIEDSIRVLACAVSHGLDATLSIVGTAPNHEYTKSLLKLSKDLDMLARVDFTGMIDDADMLSSYDKASILLSMSRHEGFCIPALEAMYRGIPAVVRAGHAAAEVVGDTGLVTDVDATPERIAESILSLRRGEQWHELQRRARARAESILNACNDERWSTLLNTIGQGA